MLPQFLLYKTLCFMVIMCKEPEIGEELMYQKEVGNIHGVLMIPKAMALLAIPSLSLS